MKAALFAISLITLCACQEKSGEQKVQEQIKEKVHALTGDERLRAQTNGKQFFEKQWAIAGNERGQLNECRPSDSNFNGLVTCLGFVPQPGGGFREVKRYCGYTPELVGCSDEDTVK